MPRASAAAKVFLSRSDDCVLKAGNQVEDRLRAEREGFFCGLPRFGSRLNFGGALCDAFAQAVQLYVAQNRCFDA